MKRLAWFVLVALGVAGTLVALLASRRPQNAVAVGIISIAVWSAFGAVLAHFTGVRRKLLRHLGRRFRPAEAQVVSQLVSANDRPNLQLALDALRARRDPPRPVLGHHSPRVPPDSLITANPTSVPVEWERFPKSLTESIDCATNAIYLLHHGEEPYVAVVQLRSEQSRGPVHLSILARSRELAQAALDEILARADAMSVYRGAVLSLEPAPKGAPSGGFSRGSGDAGADGREPYTIRFHELPAVDRSQVILPEQVLEAVERNVLGLLAHSRVLRRAGRGIRHGVLLHGPPGTGKTLVVKYLARACPDFTVILLTGRNLRFVRQSCRLARLLAPSMVVMEDVDLVAIDRRRGRNTTVLHWLMDEMDGLGPKAETIFVLTTNRPAVLERALTARPGRVDQAIYFPLPDAECRRRLFTHFSAGLDVSGMNLESLIARTEGASPAFLQELFRRAALMAAERGERSDPLRVTGADFDRAIHELVEVGGELTRSLLGFASDRERRLVKRG